MDLSAILLLLTSLALVVFGVRLSRAPARQVLDWWVTFAVVAIAAALGWFLVPRSAGWVAFGTLCTLVFAPLRIDRAAQRLARAGQDGRARTLSRIAATLHPFGAIGSRPVAIAALARIRETGDVDAETLKSLGATSDPILGEWYRVLALHAAADAAGMRQALALPSRRARLLSLGLGTAWVRAVAMTGTRADVVAAIEEAERIDGTLDDPERRASFALEACAALGDPIAARVIGTGLEEVLPRGAVARSIAAAQLESGDRAGARETIARALEGEIDPAVRRALERLRARVHEPRGERSSEGVDRRARAVLARLVREARATEALSALSDGTRTTAWATWSLVIAIVGWYAVVAAHGDTMDAAHLARMGGLELPIEGFRGAVRLVTSTFVHYGVVHLVFNLYALVAFGRFVESFYGRARLLGIWLAATVTSGLGVAAMSDPSKPHVLVGASGAIFGLGGALVSAVLFRRELRRSRRGREELSAFAVLVGLQFVFDRVVPGVSGTAHVCGLIGGILAGAVLLPRSRPLEREEPAGKLPTGS